MITWRKLLRALKRWWPQRMPSSEPILKLQPQFLGLLVRCKDEPFVQEFCDHYLSEGVDRIIIIDDDSKDKSIYRGLPDDHVTIIFGKDIIDQRYVDYFYDFIRQKFEWLIYVDVDEFISARRDPALTIRKALETVFASADCVKVPWVMMSCALREESPASLRLDLVHRWNHDLRHPSPVHKFRCRYDRIEVKSIFRPNEFELVTDHFPRQPRRADVRIVDSVTGAPAPLDSFHQGLREADIERSILACHHYRIPSVEDCRRKMKGNIWYREYSLEDLLASDHAEVFDDTLRRKAQL